MWLKILDKGMVTIPKNWRDELGFKKGGIIKAYKEGAKLIIEAQAETAPYRIYSDEEIDEWLNEDQLSESLLKKINLKIKTIKGA